MNGDKDDKVSKGQLQDWGTRKTTPPKCGRGMPQKGHKKGDEPKGRHSGYTDTSSKKGKQEGRQSLRHNIQQSEIRRDTGRERRETRREGKEKHLWKRPDSFYRDKKGRETRPRQCRPSMKQRAGTGKERKQE